LHEETQQQKERISGSVLAVPFAIINYMSEVKKSLAQGDGAYSWPVLNILA